ncbi:MAG: type II toxin-antitoxin system RelE/ParE family toxin [Candidatus Aminicenantes bacterium]|nr:type II toxin-antitoxin system RelE/ParE family toxin [Candidatus Aminicenantes bacterium]RLE01766.1 MAG: type II toxin-antitoxin system RelE/ParE family toxin [Candidatus Aminicenantes bacterium]RLE01900.1 MAG: type II toxin-antitoxin system RelE/ParE family toxin [Candidatus Aminicenantes bacterium]HHF43274.1 type II toxin-antitoxin system RelE/ParE family toxin [Candidatus Aminicenantes bacterium]
MDSYEIRWKHSVEKDLKEISPKEVRRILKSINSLANNPFPLQAKKLRTTERLYRIRVGDYRVIYEVDKEMNVITIYYVRHQKDVYRKI